MILDNVLYHFNRCKLLFHEYVTYIFCILIFDLDNDHMGISVNSFKQCKMYLRNITITIYEYDLINSLKLHKFIKDVLGTIFFILSALTFDATINTGC